ncbi:HNH/endonuclease VII fold putative polymorphic toxin, partial [Avibacterium avium]|uniref:HNH/endonuclease VII fold putative polymorphic toxin n=1 Tax=Avibacterium avium TaxID=751 RepID=UPI003BF7AC01
DQLAYTKTFKNGKLDSERHSIFNGWQLIAQQDRYQQLKQTIDGNIVEWKQETGYAICQPNGQVLALLNPQGRTLWRKEKHSLWGLCFANEYRLSNPIDPQMLFAGQWLDEESGLAYNRFRYYDPESGNYISSDPIGLAGGETPYGYVHNPMGAIDPFGLTSYTPPSKKSSYFATSRKEALNKAKRDAGIPRTQNPSKVTREDLLGYDKFGNKVPVMENGKVVQTRNYHFTNNSGDHIIIQEHSRGHSKAVSGAGKEPHFNVRPITNTNTGSYPGTYGHYNF